MADFYIEYNPYKVECIFKMNGKKIEKGKFKSVEKQRLQFFLEKIQSSGWDGLPHEIARVFNEDRVKIIFRGRKIDFDDLQFCIKKYSGNTKFTLEYIEAKNDEDVLKEIDSIVAEFDKGPIQELRDVEIKKTYEEVKNSKFQISVIATISSGKSTVINSLIGNELLPSAGGSCTASIARIMNNNNATEFTAECSDKYENIIYKRQPVTISDITEFNKDDKVKYIDIVGKIPSISSEKINLLLVDTPGPNKDGDDSHKELTESVIKGENNSVILYVFTPVAIDTKDDAALLLDISTAMKRGGKQSKDRFIFVVNKCDELQKKKDESVIERIQKAKEKLKEYGIEDPNIFAVSGEFAKLIRMEQNGVKLDYQEKNKLGLKEMFVEDEYYHFERHATLSPSCRATIDEKLSKAKQEGDIDTQALIHTGIPALEETINEYLEKYAYPFKIEQAIKKFKEIIVEKDMIGKFDEAISLDNKLLEKVKCELNIAKQKSSEMKEKSKGFKKKIKDFKVDKQKKTDVLRSVEEMINKSTKKYNSINYKVEKTEAEKLCDEFSEKVKVVEKSYKEYLDREINDVIIDESEKMLNEYKQYILQIKENITIPNYDFDKIVEFKNYNFNNIGELIKKNTKKEDIYEMQKCKNPEREGFWGWFKFWKDDFIDTKVKVGEKQYVEISKVIEEEIVKIKVSINKNIEEVFSNSQNRIEKFKEYFNTEIDNLNQTVCKILEDIEEKTKNKSQIDNRVKDNKQKFEWINNVLNKIESIINF